MQTVKIKKSKTKMIAHRGLSGIEPQNTSIAFAAAGNRSYFGIETDVHITKDGKYVIIHDDVTSNVSKPGLTVENTDFEVLRNIYLNDNDGSAGRIELKIPSLEEYMRICRKYEKTAVLELKNRFAFEHIGEIIKITESIGQLENTIFISFDYGNLTDVKKILPEQPVQFLTGEEVTDGLISRLAGDRIDLDIFYQRLNEENIKRLHDNGITVNCWTCDSPEEGEKLAGWGVDYITTNILE